MAVTPSMSVVLVEQSLYTFWRCEETAVKDVAFFKSCPHMCLSGINDYCCLCSRYKFASTYLCSYCIIYKEEDP